MSLVEEIPGFPDVVRVRADNPSMLTLSGTNSWVVGRDPAWVVDPGPALPAHLDTLLRVAGERGGLGGIAVTHHHADHVEGAEPLRALAGADHAEGLEPLLALADSLSDRAGPFDVVPVPGHAPDHVCFVYRDAVCFTGDCVLGEGSVFIAEDLAGYLDGLRRLRALPLQVICPGHGPAVFDPAAKLDSYIAHRLDRERRLIEALDAGLRTEDELLDRVWDDAPAALRPAAAITLRAHLQKLRGEGR